MVGMPLLTEAPVYKADVPEVLYEDLWISHDMIVFTGLEVPSDTYRLVVKMSPAQSPGTSSGWSKTVIVAPGIVDDWGDADITKLSSKNPQYILFLCKRAVFAVCRLHSNLTPDVIIGVF